MIAAFAAYLVLIKYHIAFIIILAIAVAYLLDAVDGYLATRDASKGKIGLIAYLKYSLGGKTKLDVGSYKRKTAKVAPKGARIDVAGDRIVEYLFLLIFLYLHVIPFFLVIVILLVAMHSVTDALMANRGTSIKAKSAFTRIFYTSNASRWFSGFIKFLTFSYLVLIYISGYPVWIGSVIAYIMFGFVIIRGFAQIKEAL